MLEDVEPEVSPSKKTSRELAGTLRNLKKIEQALQTLDRLSEQVVIEPRVCFRLCCRIHNLLMQIEFLGHVKRLASQLRQIMDESFRA